MIERVIQQQSATHPRIAFKTLDIETVPELEAQFGFSVPVVLVNDLIVSESRIDGRAIRIALESIKN